MSEEEGTMDSGVRVVGASTAQSPLSDSAQHETGEPVSEGSGQKQGTDRTRNRRAGRALDGTQPRRLLAAVSVLAALGLFGTLIFGLLWAGAGSSAQTDPAMVSAARSFLNDLTNFNAKSIDGDFGSITSMATGSFEGQATKFFNSSIRSELEAALAESRGQIRDLYVQGESGNQAVIYAVVDQVYVNNKISTPQSDVLRIVVNLQKVASVWKISDVTVLEGATPASAGSASGSAGSTVPGQ